MILIDLVVGSGILPYTEADMQKIATRIAKKAEEMGGSELVIFMHMYSSVV